MALRSEVCPVGKDRSHVPGMQTSALALPAAAIGGLHVVSGDVASADAAQARATTCADIL